MLFKLATSPITSPGDYMKVKLISFVSFFLLFAVQNVLALVITSPKNGSTYKTGDTVKVVAELSQGSDYDKILWVDFLISEGLNESCPKEIATHPRYECTFTITQYSPQIIIITALGKTVDSAVVSPTITISVPLPSSVTLQSLKSFTGNRQFFSQIGDHNQLYIVGTYSDAIERDIWLAEKGTTYISSNEKVVTVNVNGLITATGAGKAQITVKNGSKKLVIDAIVQIR
ncbi:MAG: hypothetical protein EPN25_05665 [Nitrospirae bacterium]|nr:MAG: hypothetical protein EPN25_05665 [Nitrospirota bacterium]